MKDLAIRAFSVLSIVTFIISYNMTVRLRAKDNEIARVNAELKSANQVVEYYYSVVANQSDEDHEVELIYNDGVYEGTAQGFGGDITVVVTIEKDMITNISVTKADGEDGAYLDMAKEIIDKIIAGQSTDPDTVCGATFSSLGIRNATEKALEKAEK